jgi:hypothetical protein
VAEQRAASIGPGFVPARPAAVLTIELDGEAVLLDERENRLHHLNHTAALLWLCFDGHASLAELAVELSEALGTDADRVLADVVAVARRLGAEGLLDGVAADPRPPGGEA